MIKKFLAFLLTVVLCGSFVACGDVRESESNSSSTPLQEHIFPQKENIVDDRQYYTGIDEIQFPTRLWNTPVFERASQYDRDDQGAKAYFLQSVHENGEPTYVFAFVGIPDTATKEKPVPGVVLIHGGGGTAFPDWVKMWNDKGYAAIAIDTEGNIPNANVTFMSKM